MTRPIRILRVIGRMNVGGPAWQVSALTRGLPEHGIESTLISGEVSTGEADYLDLWESDLPVIKLAGLGRSVRLLGDLSAFVSLIRLMRAERPDIVHTHAAKAGVVGRMAAIVARVPVVVHTFHGHLLHGYFRPSIARAIRIVEAVLARRTTALIAVGSRVRDELLAAGIGDPDRFIVVAPGVDEPPVRDRMAARRALGLSEDDPVVLFVGRLTWIKRVDRLIEAMAAVQEKVQSSILVVAGDGELSGELQEMAAHAGVRAEFLGWRSDTASLYAAADLVVLSSDNEGMPVTLLEAAMSGVPAVTTDVGSASEVVIDGETGLVVNCNAASLAGGMVDLLNDATSRRRMGEAARERVVLEFGTERLVRDHVDLYRRLVGLPA